MKHTHKIAELPQRILGKTRLAVPVLGIGTAPGGTGLTDKDAIRLYHRAIDLGVTYIDTAPGYGNAETQLSHVLKDRREEVIVTTKAPVEDRDGALASLEKSLRTLKTERVDIAFVHGIGSMDVERIMSPQGALAGLKEARRRGWTRFIGVTDHNTAWKSARIVQEYDIDVIMVTLNYADRFTYGFENSVLPLAKEKNVGALAMKVFGGARNMQYNKPAPSALEAQGPHDLHLSFRYAMGSPGVACLVIGVFSEQELAQNIAWACSFKPLEEREKSLLEKLGRETAAKLGKHFG